MGQQVNGGLVKRDKLVAQAIAKSKSDPSTAHRYLGCVNRAANGEDPDALATEFGIDLNG
jgi:hypothetical protein